jgi:hypothetical protein
MHKIQYGTNRTRNKKQHMSRLLQKHNGISLGALQRRDISLDNQSHMGMPIFIMNTHPSTQNFLLPFCAHPNHPSLKH